MRTFEFPYPKYIRNARTRLVLLTSFKKKTQPSRDKLTKTIHSNHSLKRGKNDKIYMATSI